MSFLTTVCFSYYTVKRLVQKWETKRAKKNYLFLYTDFALIVTKKTVGFPLSNPVHQVCWSSTYGYSNIYKSILYIYTHKHTSNKHCEDTDQTFAWLGASPRPLKNKHRCAVYKNFNGLGLAISPQFSQGKIG